MPPAPVFPSLVNGKSGSRLSVAAFSAVAWSHWVIGMFLMLQCGGGGGGPSPNPFLPPLTSLSNNSSSILSVFSLCLPPSLCSQLLVCSPSLTSIFHTFLSSQFPYDFCMTRHPSSPCHIPHECTTNMRLSSCSEVFKPSSLEFCPCFICVHARMCWCVHSSRQERNSLGMSLLLSPEPCRCTQVEPEISRANSGWQEGNVEFHPTGVQTNKSDLETLNWYVEGGWKDAKWNRTSRETHLSDMAAANQDIESN